MLAFSHATVRLAQELVENYGEDAERAAADRIEAMVKVGNAEAEQVWRAVSEVITQARGCRCPDA